MRFGEYRAYDGASLSPSQAPDKNPSRSLQEHHNELPGMSSAAGVNSVNCDVNLPCPPNIALIDFSHSDKPQPKITQVQPSTASLNSRNGSVIVGFEEGKFSDERSTGL